MNLGKNLMSAFENIGQSSQEPSKQEEVKPVETPDEEVKPEETVETKPEEEVKPNTEEPKPEQQNNPNPTIDTEEPKPTVEDPKPIEEETRAELNDDAVLEYLRKTSGQELSSIQDLFKKPEPTADPLEGLSDEALQFLNYTKETGRGYSDFQELNKDYSKMSDIDAARESAIQMSDGILNRSNVDDYLQEELNIDVEDIDGLTPIEKMRLKAYGKEYIKSQIEAQEKYKQPIERKPQEGQPEMVTLEDGSLMEKTAYDNAMKSQIAYQEGIKKSTDNITSSTFKVKIDDNGTDKEIELSYDYSKDDKHRMVSNALDVNKFVQEISGSDNGLNYAAHQENLQWYDPKFREKAFASLAHKLLAQQAEDFMAKRTNATVDKNKTIPNTSGNGKKLVIPSATGNMPGLKYNFDNL